MYRGFAEAAVRGLPAGCSLALTADFTSSATAGTASRLNAINNAIKLFMRASRLTLENINVRLDASTTKGCSQPFSAKLRSNISLLALKLSLQVHSKLLSIRDGDSEESPTLSL
jgi:hypothetical protein